MGYDVDAGDLDVDGLEREEHAGVRRIAKRDAALLGSIEALHRHLVDAGRQLRNVRRDAFRVERHDGLRVGVGDPCDLSPGRRIDDEGEDG